MASKSYGWDVRNIAKISPKMVKKGPFFDFRKKDLSRLLYRTCGSGYFIILKLPLSASSSDLGRLLYKILMVGDLEMTFWQFDGTFFEYTTIRLSDPFPSLSNRGSSP